VLHDFFSRPAFSLVAGDADFLVRLVDPVDELARAWDAEYAHAILRGLLALAEPEFSPTTWRAFRRLALDGASPRVVAAELGLTVNAVTIAKCRVLSWLRREARGLIDESAPECRKKPGPS
jgi:RNA polymerase sigma-70 factor (ECF subfamily)